MLGQRLAISRRYHDAQAASRSSRDTRYASVAEMQLEKIKCLTAP
jgi:hypothetical protein